MSGLAEIGAGAAATLMALVAAFLFCRRASGALVHPLPDSLVLGATAVWALASLTARYLPGLVAGPQRRAVPSDRPSSSLPICCILTVASAAWLAAISLPGTSPAALLVLWGVTLGMVYAGWRPWLPMMELRPRLPRLAARSQSVETHESEDLPSADATQRLLRRGSPGNKELIEGTLRVAFAGGERSAAAHVAFCPALEPDVECFAEQIDGPPATVRVTQLLAYGARFEVKLDRVAARAESVVLRFVAEGGNATASRRSS